MTRSEEFIPSFNFRHQIITAINNAPQVELSASHQSIISDIDEAKNLHHLAHESDDELVQVDDDNLAGDIIIDDAHAYPLLVHQALEIVYPLSPKAVIDEWSVESVEHEMAHAAAAGMLGKEVLYGVRIIKVRDEKGERNLMSCFINLKGQNITKSELAFITAAPEVLGEKDQHILLALGFSALG